MVVLSSEALQIVALLVAFILPAVVALVTKRLASGTVKSLTLVALAALLAVLTEVFTVGSFVPFDAIILFVQTFVVAVTAHFGLLKPTRVTGANGRIADSTPDKGIG